MKVDPQIDTLYQLPLEEFTKKRNALAKELSGAPRKQVKFLAKPPLPIWAVNQLYWHDRPTYNALIDASEKLRTAHLSALGGGKVDLRKPEQVHRAALDKATAKTIGLLEQSQGNSSDAARDTIRKALAALPNDEAPGRLTRAPEAAGFSLLTGIKPREFKSEPAPKETREKEEKPPRANAAKERAEQAQALREQRDRENALAAAERDLQQSRKAVEQAKFKVRKLMTELREAQTAEDARAGELSAAEEKVAGLRLTLSQRSAPVSKR